MDDTPPTTPVACANCDWTGPSDKTEGCRDFWSRVEPGEVIPHGDCPKCGAFCYAVEAQPDTSDLLKTLLASMNQGQVMELVEARFEDPANAAFVAAVPTDDELELDDHVLTSRADLGCWVQAWVYITNEQAGVEDGSCEGDHTGLSCDVCGWTESEDDSAGAYDEGTASAATIGSRTDGRGDLPRRSPTKPRLGPRERRGPDVAARGGDPAGGQAGASSGMAATTAAAGARAGGAVPMKPTVQQVIDVLTLRSGSKHQEALEAWRRNMPRISAVLDGQSDAYAEAANLVRRMLIEGRP